MDEINAVLELFVSCRSIGWPLVRLEAAQQLLTQHLLMAAPMDKDEIADLIKRCFEADNNGEINFLSFWAGMESLLELLGLRDRSAYVDEKIYGLQIFRDGLLAEAQGKHEGPTNSVLLTRDEVLEVIDRTNQSLSSRHRDGLFAGGTYQDGDDANSKSFLSSPFWDEVHRETEQLEPSSVLSMSELSMMVFGFLKSYVREGHPSVRPAEQDYQVSAQPMNKNARQQVSHSATDGASSVVSDSEYAAGLEVLADSSCAGLGSEGEGMYRRELREESSARAWSEPDQLPPTSVCADSTAQSQRELGQEHAKRQRNKPPRLDSSLPSWTSKGALGTEETETAPPNEGPEFSPSDDAEFLRYLGTELENPSLHLRQLLLATGEITQRGSFSKKAVQQLRYLNAAAVDCLDRLAAEQDKKNDEMSDAFLSLGRVRAEKQQLVERLTNLEQQHSHLQSQHEQQQYDRRRLDQLEATLTSERLERERIQRSLLDKEEELDRANHENDRLREQVKSLNDDLTRRVSAIQSEKLELTADYRDKTAALIREKEALEEKLRSAEDRADAADAARQKLQGDAQCSDSALRQRILELEDDKQRHETEAEENDALIAQLQGRLEEKVQQVTILELKNKQQLRLLQQVRGVRNSLMQLLQEAKEKEVDSYSSSASGTCDANANQEILKLKAGMKAAQAHIRELETFIEEIRKEQRRALHPRSELVAASGHSSEPSSQRHQVGRFSSLPLRALPTLGAELEQSGTLSLLRSPAESSISIAATGPSSSTGGSAHRTPSSALPHDNLLAPASDQSKDSHMQLTSCVSIVTNQGQEHPNRLIAADSDEQHIKLRPPQPVASTIGVVQSSATSHRKEAGRGGDSGTACSLASLRSEPSTADALSKEPTSCTSLAEVEDVFGSTDRRRNAMKVCNSTLNLTGKLGQSVSAARVHADPLNLLDSGNSPESESLQKYSSKQNGVEGVANLRRLCSVARRGPRVSSPRTAETASSADRDNSALELLMGGATGISRRASTSGTVRQLHSSAESSSVSPIPDSGSAEPRTACHSERNAIRAPDGGFFLLDSPRETEKLSAGSVGRKGEERSYQAVQELATGPLDAGALSDMFSMLGACASLRGSVVDRLVRSGDPNQKVSHRAQSSDEQQRAGERSSPKGKYKQSTRLSAAATAAISSKDSSGFRSLRRVSQLSANQDEQHGDADVFSSTPTRTTTNYKNRDSGILQAFDSSNFQASILTRTSPTDEAKPLTRARRTVSLGVTDAVAKGESSDTQMLPMHNVCEERKFPKLENAGLSFDSKSEDIKDENAFFGNEACHSGRKPDIKHNARSRNSSSESPVRRGPSFCRETPGERELKGKSKGNEAKESGNRQEGDCVSKSSHEADIGDGAMMAEGHSSKSSIGESESCDVPNMEEQDIADAGAKSGGGENSPSSCGLRNNSELLVKPRHDCQHARGAEAFKLQDDQTASAAALLAAAAGVVDASLQQQQQMIQRQQEHHEDLQRAQQRRIDMLQEQLEFLQRSKEEQRESGEQHQRKAIETLQAKLEELQRRQEQRDQDFQEAQRKLLQHEVQLKQKFEELRCSRSSSLEVAGACSLSREDVGVVRSHRLSTDLHSCQHAESGCSRTATLAQIARDKCPGEANMKAAALHESELSRVTPCTAVSQNVAGGSFARPNQVFTSRTIDDNTLTTSSPWHRRRDEQFGAERSTLISASDSKSQRRVDLPGRATRKHIDPGSDSDDTSSCASSSIMGSQCGTAVSGSLVEDMPTTSCSPFISQVATSGTIQALPPHLSGRLVTDGRLERHMPTRRGDLPSSHVSQTNSIDSLLNRQVRLRNQPSDPILASHQHLSTVQPDAYMPAFSVHRANSSTGSLWSPTASKRRPSGLGEACGFGGAISATRLHADLATSYNSGSATSVGRSQDTSYHGEIQHSSGIIRQNLERDRKFREADTPLGRSSASTHHPVSRAERSVPLQQQTIDSARFLGGSSTGDKSARRSETSRRSHVALPSHEPNLACPPASARSHASTASYATTSSKMTHISRTPQRTRGGGGECSAPSGDFLAVTAARSTTSRRHKESRSSQATSAKRSGHGCCNESQVSPSVGRSRNQSGGRQDRSPTAVTRGEPLVRGSRRTVNSLMSKLPCSSASGIQSPRLKVISASSPDSFDTPQSASTEPSKRERSKIGEAAPAYYRRAATSETLPDVDRSGSTPRQRRRERVGSNKKDKSEDDGPHDKRRQAENSSARDSNSSAQHSMGWSGFNSGFMSQVQKWIS